MPEANTATREFHVSRQARDKHQFDESLFTLTGNVLFANFRAARGRLETSYSFATPACCNAALTMAWASV